MLNTDAFLRRLEQLMENQQLNAAALQKKLVYSGHLFLIFYHEETSQV